MFDILSTGNTATYSEIQTFYLPPEAAQDVTGEMSETVTERERFSSPMGEPSNLHSALHLPTPWEWES